MKRNISTLLLGVIFLLAGFCYIGSIFLDFSFTLFFDGWWTMFIIIPAFISILSNGPRAFNSAAMLVGVFLLLTRLDIIPSGYTNEALVAGVVLYIGVVLITRFIRPAPPINYYTYVPPVNGESKPYTASPKATVDQQDFPTYTAILTGINSRCSSTNFQGARVAAILGGVDLDLRNVIITKDITIYVTAIMGGVDILAPQNIRIGLNNTDILGSTSCTAIAQPSDSNVPLVNFVTTTVMGGIEIK